MQDKDIVHTIARGLLLIGLVAVLGVILLAFAGKEQPDVLGQVAAAALAAAGALLANTRTTEGAQPVQVVNADSQPVPVEEAPKPARAR